MVSSVRMKVAVHEIGKFGPLEEKPKGYSHIAWTFRVSGTFAICKDKWREKPKNLEIEPTFSTLSRIWS
ncbi:hypothetical protein PHISCL_04238 [Aspergillus sclerotialis]|uniref:Uncharacterized protein n=1 Tax=Aspergillus sclerotialis TaxID=2070753 RepID=A0A3A2ZLI3_9EURO|nr:hypothetical protein PHISCL_04238 [Aspergillus sclerotialis]